DEALKAVSFKRRIKLVGEVQVVAAVGDEDAKLAPVGRVGSARLLRSYITGFWRSRTGCVMRDVCHCTAPIAALNISTFGKGGGSATSRQSLGVAALRVGFSRRIMKGRVTRRHAVAVDARLRPARGPYADAWLRADARGRDGGVREELAAGIAVEATSILPS